MIRQSEQTRTTKETDVRVKLNLDGSGVADIQTGIGFLDHMYTALCVHAGLDLTMRCQGDLVVDDHHTAEDTALMLGAALDLALGERIGIQRFGDAAVPLDEALAFAAIDLSGRPFAKVDLKLRRPNIGQIACENLSHVLSSFATAARLTLHVNVSAGENDHHKAEAAFKAVAVALRQAVRLTTSTSVPSSKGVL
jgi:imidazoleglycerol-phosphate dehydratase